MALSLRELHHQIQSDDWDTALCAADALVGYGSAALPVLIPLLQSESPGTRNAAALAVRDIADSAAVAPLVHAIRNPKTAGTRGTLVYALETHDCSDYLLFLFDLTLNDTFEVQNHALTILYQQQFWYTRADLNTAQTQLKAYSHQLNRPAGSDRLISELHALLAELRQQAQA